MYRQSYSIVRKKCHSSTITLLTLFAFFWIGKTKYITAQIRQTKTKEILSTLREDSDVEVLRQRPEISWVIQEKAYVRKTRTMDTEWPNLWHLNDDISPTLKVNEAWTAGYSGQGINIAVLDDGLQTDHPDLAANVDTANDIDIYGFDNNPYPTAGNSHGTEVSGFIGAVKDNNICVVGVAFNCTVIENSDSSPPAFENRTDKHFDVPSITKDEMKDIYVLEILQLGKAVGYDKKSNTVLKHTSTTVCKLIQIMFNKS
ncbi:PCSK4 [Mytilus coruscus]|uniref:PCSK4 n=1 Tax=Mytilus coruscus TaxID=42192 RepID=A0A6J8A9R7_MYTCO|nr:PCSK4 [Mytilus coruscus]